MILHKPEDGSSQRAPGEDEGKQLHENTAVTTETEPPECSLLNVKYHRRVGEHLCGGPLQISESSFRHWGPVRAEAQSNPPENTLRAHHSCSQRRSQYGVDSWGWGATSQAYHTETFSSLHNVIPSL